MVKCKGYVGEQNHMVIDINGSMLFSYKVGFVIFCGLIVYREFSGNNLLFQFTFRRILMFSNVFKLTSRQGTISRFNESGINGTALICNGTSLSINLAVQEIVRPNHGVHDDTTTATGKVWLIGSHMFQWNAEKRFKGNMIIYRVFEFGIKNNLELFSKQQVLELHQQKIGVGVFFTGPSGRRLPEQWFADIIPKNATIQLFQEENSTFFSRTAQCLSRQT